MSGDIKLNIYTANYVKRDGYGRNKNNKSSQKNLNLFQFPENKDDLYDDFLESQKEFPREPVKRDALEAIAEYIIDNDALEDDFTFDFMDDDNLFSSDNFFANGKYKDYYNSLDLSFDGIKKSMHSFLSVTSKVLADNKSDEILYLPYFEKDVA